MYKSFYRLWYGTYYIKLWYRYMFAETHIKKKLLLKRRFDRFSKPAPLLSRILHFFLLTLYIHLHMRNIYLHIWSMLYTGYTIWVCFQSLFTITWFTFWFQSLYKHVFPHRCLFISFCVEVIIVEKERERIKFILCIVCCVRVCLHSAHSFDIHNYLLMGELI